MQGNAKLSAPTQITVYNMHKHFQGEEGMIYLLLLYMHLCHYTGGETSSYISCHLFAYRLHVLLKINGVVYTLGKIF